MLKKTILFILVMGVSILFLGESSLLANTLAHWDFNEGSGDTLHDISGNGHHGIIYGNANWITGYNGNGLEFDNQDDSVICGVIQPYLTTSFTVEVIFKAYNTGQEDYIFHTNGWDPAAYTAIYIIIKPSGILECCVQTREGPHDVEVRTPNIVNDSNWHHVALVYDNVNVKLYLDCSSTPVDQTPQTGAIHEQNNGTFIGRYGWWQDPELFSGVIDELRISSTALSPDQFLEFGPLIGDVNCDEKVTVSDVIYLINYLFKGGPPPCRKCY